MNSTLTGVNIELPGDMDRCAKLGFARVAEATRHSSRSDNSSVRKGDVAPAKGVLSLSVKDDDQKPSSKCRTRGQCVSTIYLVLPQFRAELALI